MKKTFKVSIIETLQMEVEIEADNSVEASGMVARDYKDGKYTLDSSHFKQVNFTSRTAERSRRYVR